MRPGAGRCRWAANHQRRARELGAHGPADDLAGCQVERCGQIQPSLASGDARDIGQPDPVRRDRQIVVAVGRAGPQPAPGQRADAVSAHPPLDAATTAPMALRPQSLPRRRPGRHASWAIRIVLDGAPGDGARRQAAPGSASSVHSAPTAPVVIAAARHAGHAAHDVHRPGGPMLLDESELHCGISAKMLTAFSGCPAPSEPDPVRDATARLRTPDPPATPSLILARRRACRRGTALLQLALPATQHRRQYPQLGRHLAPQSAIGFPQQHLALERIREPTLRRTRYHTPPGSAEPIIGVRQTEGRSVKVNGLLRRGQLNGPAA